VVSSWEILSIGIVLGALAMRCAMLDHRLHWLKLNAIGLNTSNSTDWVYHDSCDATPLMLLEDTTSDAREKIPPAAEASQIGGKQVVKEMRNEQSIRVNPDVATTGMSLNEDAIELHDLDDLEGYLYEDTCPVPAKAETAGPAEAPKFPDSMWKVSYSVDAVMRPMQQIFAPELAYQAIDAELGNSKFEKDAYDDNRELVKTILRVLGRFAVRKDNSDLLKKVQEYSPRVDQESLWQLLQVAIESKRLQCFAYLFPLVDGTDAKARVLELCAYHNRVGMTKQAFSKWTKFVKSDTANAPLVVAAAQGRVEMVQFLLTKCTDVEISIKSSFVDEKYPNPVMAAAAGGHIAILQELVAAGAKIRLDDPVSKLLDPFEKAMATKNANMLASLIQCDPYVFRYRSRSVDSILEFALEQNHPGSMQLILAEEVKRREVIELCSSLLRSACQKGYLEIIHILIDHEARYYELLPSLTKEEEAILYTHTARGRYEIIVKLLQKHCPDGCHNSIPDSSIVSRLAWLGDFKGLDMLFAQEPDIDVNLADHNKNSPLFYAMYSHLKGGYVKKPRQQWLRTIRILLARGAKLNISDTWYWTTYHQGIPKSILSDLEEYSKSAESVTK
jgi:hypothetical protein